MRIPMVSSVLLTLLFPLGAATPPVHAQGSDPGAFHMCAGRILGVVRMVAPTASCGSQEIRLIVPAERRVATLDTKAASLTTDLEAAKTTLGKARTDLDATRSATAALDTRTASLTADLEVAKTTLTKTRLDLDAAKAAGTATRADLATAQADLDATKAALAGARADLATANADLAVVRADVVKAKADLVGLRTDATAARADVEALAPLVSLAPYVAVETRALNGLAGPHLILTGANVHIRSGSGKTDGVPNGLGNLILGYNELDADVGLRTAAHTLVVGPFHSYSSWGGLVAGVGNAVTAPAASVTGGTDNIASAEAAVVVGGSENEAAAAAATVGGGEKLRAAVPRRVVIPVSPVAAPVPE